MGIHVVFDEQYWSQLPVQPPPDEVKIWVHSPKAQVSAPLHAKPSSTQSEHRVTASHVPSIRQTWPGAQGRT